MSYQEEGDAELFDSDEDIPVPPPPAGDDGEDEDEEEVQDTPSKGESTISDETLHLCDLKTLNRFKA